MMQPATEIPTKSRLADSTLLILLGQMALKSTWTIFFFTSFFDVIAFGLALGAQSKGNRVYWDFDHGSEYYYCKYNTDVASGMAIGAFLFLLTGQTIVMGATRCFCCGGFHKPGAARLCAVFLLSLCWFCFVIAQIIFLVGATRSSIRTRTRTFGGKDIPSCETIRSGIFGAAGAFTFLTWLLSMLYYMFTVKSQEVALPS